MPIYEFYCARCHTVFNFLSRRIETGKRPACPRCGRPELDRRASRFAVSRGRGEPDEGGAGEDLEDARMDQAMEALAREAEGLDESNPRQIAGLMRRFYDSTGLKLGSGMEEAIRRMEAGDDPDAIEEEMGDVLGDEDPFGDADEPAAPEGRGRLRALRRRMLPPAVDRTLYEM